MSGERTPEDWKRVMWSDESRDALFCTDERLRFGGTLHEAMNPFCLTRAVQESWGPCNVAFLATDTS
ncbi:hypothetical protein TNCV_2533821 [Trichonephila clavipes]|nr:hypothetical protein TNCV_2533821 [Trichonephila clavipes]